MMKHTALILMTAAALMTGVATAHTELSATAPDNGAMIAAAPENLELTFTEPVRLTALSIQKDGAQKQSLGPLPTGTTEHFSVALPAAIDDGHYVVAWRALTEDTHIMNGEFMFAVGAEGTHDAHMNHEDMPAGEHHAIPADDHHDDHGGAH